MHITDVARVLPHAIHRSTPASRSSAANDAAKTGPRRDARVSDHADRTFQSATSRVGEQADGLHPRQVKRQLRRIAKQVGEQLGELTRELAKNDLPRTDKAPNDATPTDPVATIRELGRTFRHDLRAAFRDARVGPHRVDGGRLLDGVQSAFDRLVTDLRSILDPQAPPAPAAAETPAANAAAAEPKPQVTARTDRAAEYDGARTDRPNDVVPHAVDEPAATEAPAAAEAEAHHGVGALVEQLQSVLAELRSTFAGTTDLRAKLTFSIRLKSRIDVLS